MIYLSVDEFHQFQCAADRCLNTCCVGWKIVMNRETYEKMVEGEEVLQIPASDWLEDKGNEISVRLDHGRCPMLPGYHTERTSIEDIILFYVKGEKR